MSSINDLPPAVQEQIKQMQNLQNQLSTFRQQIEISQSRMSELKGTLKEIEAFSEEEELFKTVGQVMFKTTVGKVKKDFAEEMELLELKTNSLKSKEEKIKTQLTDLNKSLASQLNVQ